MKSSDLSQLAKELGRRIAQKRIEVGLTQENVSEQLQIGTEAVSRIERGVAVPNALRLIELATIFGCPVEDLISIHTDRLEDQAAYIAKIIEDLSPADRAFVIETLENLANHLK